MTHTLQTSVAAALLWLAGTPALAQGDDFPAGATLPDAAAIKSQLSGNVFGATLANGATWRLQFTGAGYFFVNTSTGFNGNGSWSTEDGKLCSALRGAATTCNDVRQHDGVLMLRRTSGEIIRYLPK